MNYLLIENKTLVGICNYEPNIGNDKIKVINYSGNIPPERILYINEKIVDSKDYVFINDKYVKNTKAISELLKTNSDAKKYLAETDWLVIRHRDQLALNMATSLSEDQYIDLLNKRQAARESVVEYDS